MTTLTGTKPKNTYIDLLQVSNTNSGIDGTLRAVSDGEGTASPLELSSSAINASSGFQVGGVAFTAITPVGKHTIWIPAAAMRATVSNGCSALADVETTADRPDMQVLDFRGATGDEHAQFGIAMPSSWNEGTVTFRAFWTVAAAVTTGVAIGLQGVGMADNETIDVAYGTPLVVTDDAQGAAEELYVTDESGAITIDGTPVANDMTFFRVFRDISDGNDDMTQDMRLIGIQLFYTTDAGVDA